MAIAAATLTEILVLPTPPFVIRVTMTGGNSDAGGSCSIEGGSTPAARYRAARMSDGM